jgi:hypothetical protein
LDDGLNLSTGTLLEIHIQQVLEQENSRRENALAMQVHTPLF